MRGAIARPGPSPSPGPEAAGPATAYQFGSDATLLSSLVRDGRASYEDLADGIGASRQSAWRRVKALYGSVIWGFGAVVDHRKLGWRHYIVTIAGAPDAETVANVERTEAVAQSWGTLRVLQTLLVRGTGWRLVLQVAAQNSLVLEAFLQALAERFPGRSPPQVDEVEHVIRDGGFANPSRDGMAWPTRRSTP